MRRHSHRAQQHNLHVRGSNFLDSSCIKERFMTAEPPLKREHAIPRVLPGLSYQNMILPQYFSSSHVSELSWSNTPSAIQRNELSSTMCKGNPDMPSLSGGIPGIKVHQFPHLQACRGYTLFASHLYRDRLSTSNDASSLLTSQRKQKSSSSYADPLNGAPIQFLQRLSEIATLENDTTRQENMKKFKAKKEE